MDYGFDTGLLAAQKLDLDDPLAGFRDDFIFPEPLSRDTTLYFCGNSLGLQPKSTAAAIQQELDAWARYGVEGHFKAEFPWVNYHEFLTKMMAEVVGGKDDEVVCMNSLTVNLHLMMVSFYQPTAARYKILIEGGAFPSDQYAVASQARFHGFDPESAIIELKPRSGEHCLRTEDILETIHSNKDSLALVMLGGVNYLTGQLFDMQSVTQAAHEIGARVGFDLAHAAGNVTLNLHDWGVDFAVWCSYKYLNSGPGGIAGCFVHRNMPKDKIPRFEGWWGHDKESRFQMGKEFVPINSVESWQLSNPPIFQLASLRSSLELFRAAGMSKLREKSKKLTAYLQFLVGKSFDEGLILTPKDVESRGAQLSFRIPGQAKKLQKSLVQRDVICDFREPDIVRAAPAPLYNSFEDVYHFVSQLQEVIHES
ncbi:MAG: kynureninase [Pseudobacteriovorax sp.]|nr:kynureninase [Pseudobacteriovorax sp.]